MSELESLKKIDFSSENISKIFENQRKNLKQDILFLKEDVLKDFREIESKLNTKYEKQNSNTITKLHKFQNTIEVMNNKILELSNLISADKNIQQKVLNLQEFKTKISDKLMSLEIAIKTNESIIKDTINRYDKLLSESIIYQGVIGSNARFINFHQLIDFLLLNINDFITFKDKNMIDYKTYKTKLESLLNSFKMHSDSIVMANNKYTNKKILESEKKIKELINIQESKIVDIKLENNKFNSIIDNKLEEMNYEIKKNVDSKTIKEEIYSKVNEEIDLLKDFNKGVTIKFENNENEINLIKDNYKDLNNYIKDIKLGLKNQKRGSLSDASINSKSPRNNGKENTNNSKLYSRRGSLARSIIKQYIKGEIGINDLEKPIKRQRSTFINENNINYIINGNTNKNQNISIRIIY